VTRILASQPGSPKSELESEDEEPQTIAYDAADSKSGSKRNLSGAGSLAPETLIF